MGLFRRRGIGVGLTSVQHHTPKQQRMHAHVSEETLHTTNSSSQLNDKPPVAVAAAVVKSLVSSVCDGSGGVSVGASDSSSCLVSFCGTGGRIIGGSGSSGSSGSGKSYGGN